MTKYEIAREFREGVLNAIGVLPIPQPEPSAHWQAGWKAGKDAYHAALNQYLQSIGVEPMGILKAAKGLACASLPNGSSSSPSPPAPTPSVNALTPHTSS